MPRIDTTNPMEYYETLGLEWGASVMEVTKKWRKLSLIHHPDKAGPGPAAKMDAEEKMKELNNARDKIMDLIDSGNPPVKGEQPASAKPKSRRKKGSKAGAGTGAAAPDRPQDATAAELEEQFWTRMPSLIIKVEQFMDNLMPLDDPVAEKYPYNEICTHLLFVQTQLHSTPATRSRETALRGIACLLAAVKKLRIWLCKDLLEAHSIWSMWSLGHLMSFCEWCIYKGCDRYGGDDLKMDKWLLACMPEIQKQWRLALAGASEEQILAERDRRTKDDKEPPLVDEALRLEW